MLLDIPLHTDVLILGIVQGIAEILPISSSVNLYCVSKFLNLSNFTFGLKIALHVGSLIVLLFYFRKNIVDIFRAIFTTQKKVKDTYFLPLFFGTIPVVFLGSISENIVKNFNSLGIMAGSCIFFGILLALFDKISPVEKKIRKRISSSRAFIVGIFQAIAIFPGVSRLGICITSCRMFSMSRKDSIHFSLMLAIPSILGSFVLECYKSFSEGTLNEIISKDALWGIATTAVIGLLSINIVVRFMERRGFTGLVIYRILIGFFIFFL